MNNGKAKRLEGKIAMITGVGAGIGRSCAKLFAQHGARIIGCDLDLPAAEATAGEITDDGGEVIAVHAADLTSEADVARVFEVCGSTTGGLDVDFR